MATLRQVDRQEPGQEARLGDPAVLRAHAAVRGGADGGFGFLAHGGRCADLIARMDWATTPLGPIEVWQPSLRNTISLILNASIPMVLLWGSDGIVLYNDAYAAFIGDRHPAMLGTRVRESWADTVDIIDNVLKVGLSGNTLRSRNKEFALLRGGRLERVWVDLDYSPVRDEGGIPAGVLCVLAETTESVTAEQRSAFLLSLSDDLRSLRTPPEIMELATARLGEWMDASRVFYAEITGSTMIVEQDHPRGVASIVGRHSLEAFGPDLLKAYRNGTPVVVRDVPRDERLSQAARTGLAEREVGAFIDVVLFEDDACVGLLAVQSATPRAWTPAEERLVQQVGERVKGAIERARAETALRELTDTLEQQVAERTAELRRYHDIVEATATPICAFDTELRLIAFNKAHNEEFGKRLSGSDARLGQVFPDLFPPKQAAIMRKLMARALAGESFTVVEAFGASETGTPGWEMSYAPLRDAAGRVIGAFHQAVDTSERVRAQAELETAHEALRQSQKMEAMGSLTGGVAHDFNNLLTPIIGSLDMLMRKGLGNERERRLIDGALQSAERAKLLVQRLLAFARRQPLQATAVDLGNLIAGMVGLIDTTLGPNIKVTVDTQAGLPCAQADANQLEMALLNLAVNARDAMPGGGELGIVADHRSVRASEVPGISVGDYVCIAVSDNGTGMDEVTRQRAIEPFFSTKGIGKGTGLGLSMVHGLVAQLGGGLTIRSTLGEGTCMTMWLPVSAEAAATGMETPPVLAALPEDRGVVLLVEDEDLVRMSTADMLSSRGYTVVEACSAQEALGLVGGGLRPDLLVTDHLMPGMNGTELARELRRAWPDLPVLIVSGYAETDGLAADIPRLAKPFRDEELASSLAGLARVGPGR